MICISTIKKKKNSYKTESILTIQIYKISYSNLDLKSSKNKAT